MFNKNEDKELETMKKNLEEMEKYDKFAVIQITTDVTKHLNYYHNKGWEPVSMTTDHKILFKRM